MKLNPFIFRFFHICLIFKGKLPNKIPLFNFAWFLQLLYLEYSAIIPVRVEIHVLMRRPSNVFITEEKKKGVRKVEGRNQKNEKVG